MWFVFALLSAVFAALTSILAKVGIEGVNSNLATAIRTVVVLVMAWGMVFVTNTQGGLADISRKSWLFLILSGLATGASWLCYYRALQIGEASKVVPIDKLSAVSYTHLDVYKRQVYVGGYWDAAGDYYHDFVGAFGNTDAFAALPWGSLIALVFTIIYFLCRRLISFKAAMDCLPKGFINMVPAIMILTFATSLKNMTGLLGGKYFVASVMNSAAGSLFSFLPAIIFIVAGVLSFSTGTSWGTFGILLPIVTYVFDPASELFIIGVSACLAGAVFGDHCSPISDTTIMASAGAHCSHVNHVSTQLPYAMTAAAISAGCYLLCGAAQAVLGDAANTLTSFVLLACAIAIELVVLSIVRARMGHTGKEEVTKS